MSVLRRYRVVYSLPASLSARGRVQCRGAPWAARPSLPVGALPGAMVPLRDGGGRRGDPLLPIDPPCQAGRRRGGCYARVPPSGTGQG